MRLLCCAVVVLCLQCWPALGREAVVGMNERTLNAINQIQESIDAKNYTVALASLQDLRQRRLSAYETAHVHNLEGFVHYQQDDLARAQKSYEEALAQKQLPDSMIASLRLTLGRLGILQEQWQMAVDNLKALLAMENQNEPTNRILLANAYVGQGQHKLALVELTQAIAETRAKNQQPSENALSLLAAVHYDLGNLDAMREVTRELALVYPREQYFLNLAALFGQSGDQKRQLALVESLLQDGRLTQEQQIKMAASLYLALDLPYKAARLLDSAMSAGGVAEDESTLELLSQAWLSAAEPDRAIPPLERAAKLAGDGELYLSLARLHLDEYRFAEAAAAAQAAIDKGGVRQEGGAWLLYGMALARMNRWDKAAEVLARAADYDYTQRYAQQWLAYVENERKRSAAIAAES